MFETKLVLLDSELYTMSPHGSLLPPKPHLTLREQFAIGRLKDGELAKRSPSLFCSKGLSIGSIHKAVLYGTYAYACGYGTSEAWDTALLKHTYILTIHQQ